MKRFIKRFVFWEFVVRLIQRPHYRSLLSVANFCAVLLDFSETKKNECHKYTFADAREAWRKHKKSAERLRFFRIVGETPDE